MPKRKIIDWSATIKEYQNSNVTVEELCAGLGIHPNTFYKNREKHQGAETQLVKLPLKPEPIQPQSLLIHAGGGILKIPEGVDQKTPEKTILVLKVRDKEVESSLYQLIQ